MADEARERTGADAIEEGPTRPRIRTRRQVHGLPGQVSRSGATLLAQVVPRLQVPQGSARRPGRRRAEWDYVEAAPAARPKAEQGDL